MKRYIIVEFMGAGISTVRSNDISEWMSSDLGIGRYREDVVIIDTLQNQVINSNTCEWKIIEDYD